MRLPVDFTIQTETLSRVERPDGQGVEFSYNSEGKLSTITSPLGATSFSYDLKGRLATITTPDGQQLQYDYDGFLEKKVTFSGSIQGSLERVYDNDFKVTQLKLNGQLLAGFSYDNDGLLTQAGPLAITRDPQTGFWLSSQAGVVEESRSFDSYGQLQSQQFKVSGASILKITYERDSLGRITAKTEERPSGITRFEYGYDPAGRLVSETKILPDGSSLVTQWRYDGNGNRVMEVKPNGTVITGSYDDQDRLLSYGDYTFTYTANGELISKCQGSVCQYFDYDVFGNLRHVILDNGIQIEYVIDGRNRRIGKKINGTLVQGFVYDDQLRIVAELDGSNQVVSRFIYADHINVPEVLEKGGKTYRILHDHLGSPRFVLDTQTGEIAQELQYDAWGHITYDSNPGFQPFGFAGGIFDTHTRLLRLGARDYDPQIGRWTAKDPIQFEGGDTNLFGYVFANAVNEVDLTGLAIWVCVRPARDLPGNHAYFWDDRKKQACGMSASSGGDPDVNEKGPGKDHCTKIPDTDGKEDDIMKCCRENANRALWFPWAPFKRVHDCFGLIEYCLGKAGCPVLFPAGRTGPIPGRN